MYALMASRAAHGAVTLGDLTLYIAVFRQGQSAVQAVLQAVGGMYEDALFMSNLFAYLDIPTGGEAPRRAAAALATARPTAAASSCARSRSATPARRRGRCAT